MVSVEEISNGQYFFLTVDTFIPVSELLSRMNFSEIESKLHQHLGYTDGRSWEYSPLVLFKLLIVKLFRKHSYRRRVNFLTKDDCLYLGLKEIESGRFLIPVASTVHDFAYKRLGLEGLKQIMHLNGTIAYKNIRNANGMIDSTPLKRQDMINMPDSIHIMSAECIKCIYSTLKVFPYMDFFQMEMHMMADTQFLSLKKLH